MGGTSGGSGGTSASGGASGSGGAPGGASGASGSGAVSSGGASGGSGGSTGGSAGASGTGGDSGAAGAEFRLPPGNAQFDYQIGGGYTPPSGVQVVSRDREDSPAAAVYNICYVNGFQIQPHEDAWWLAEHPDLILRDANDQPVVDEGWGEMLLDVSTEAKREALAGIIGQWIDGCADDGFDAVEIDNLDSYSRSDGLLTQSQNVAFMGLLSERAHASGLAAAQKNSTELLGEVDAMGTDFAVAEECNRWNECGDYQAVYGNLVFVIEYREQDFQTGCANFAELSIVLRDVNVTTPASSSYVYDAC